ncbi:MAG: UDP-N-acetylglucosamine 1-carboxyvinyltransferase [Rhodoferax sp.]|uniref:UDP-N-acetylglucosamine 1-carboxyvinyltransferase n=1 Tax=Rhodoferax sp. TaxID=50421 RepID=UPI00261B1584|nr:UDP-N-acetylglucosamine 1-carboxyvinyltransferase [Rhodoferax sp.]MDD5335221.1 UDP-N-acetylglucosamine 1-carboxyvinyltransferase [Rhodoferax sp.]
MSIFEIEGGVPLRGTVRASGNKNAILPMIAACILTDQEVVLDNVPDIIDVRHMLEVITDLGGTVERSGERVSIHVAKLNKSEIGRELCNKVRTSILCVAPLLHRTGKAKLFPPGGDVIGRRRLDTHFYGLQKLGASMTLGDSYDLSLPHPLTGAELFFDEPSVTGTEHILMAAVVSAGHTLIRNAASEPHVQDLAHMLNAMGARITGIGTNQLSIEGVSSLGGTTHRVCHDHIEAASYLALAAATGGEIRVEGTDLHSYWMCHRVFATLGVKIELYKDHIFLSGDQEMRVTPDYDGSMPVIDDGPWPQFASDQMSCMITLATQVEGNVLFFEKMFESRLYFVDRLIAMGARAVVCDPHRVVISGRSKLRATTLSSPDIRAGMALLGAALCASGKSTVQNANMIERGYERIEEKLLGLGARITRRA